MNISISEVPSGSPYYQKPKHYKSQYAGKCPYCGNSMWSPRCEMDIDPHAIDYDVVHDRDCCITCANSRNRAWVYAARGEGEFHRRGAALGWMFMAIDYFVPIGRFDENYPKF